MRRRDPGQYSQRAVKEEPRKDYGAGLLNHDLPLEVRRLRALEDFADPATINVLSGCGVLSGRRCLEVGGGAGSIARWLACRCAPGEAVVTELNTDLLPHDVPNLTVLHHDVTKDSFPDSSFHLIHARAVLEHLPNREQIVARMASWLTPDGWLCVDAITIIGASVNAPAAYRRCLDALSTLVVVQMGVDLRWAADLPRHLAREGLQNIRTSERFGYVGRDGNADSFFRLTLNQTAPALLHLGLVQEHDIIDCIDFLNNTHYTQTRTHPACALTSARGQC